MPELEECLALLLQEIAPTEAVETISLTECEGRVAACDIRAGMMVPPFSKSAMDGYAVCAEQTAGANREQPVTLKVVGELLAGDYAEFAAQLSEDEHLGERAGIAVRVMTGAYVPKGFDAVIRQEDTDYGEDEVAIYAGVKPYTNYCAAGEDIREGDIVIAANTRITPLHIGLLASVGIFEVKVYKTARIAVISTGSELTEAGSLLAPGKIYSSISYILEATIRRQGLKVVSNVLCPDEEEVLEQYLCTACEDADMVITTGAVSVGKRDILPAVLERLGAHILFHHANIQPGTPTIGSVLNGKVILSLSGNPYAAIANFEWYFWPIMAKRMHDDGLLIKADTAILDSPYPKVNRLRRMVRAYAAEGRVTIPSQVHAASVIANLTECNCFIDLEAGRAVQSGDSVRIRYFK